MGEVGEVIPEKSTTQTLTTVTTTATTARSNNLTNGDIQNGLCKPNNNSDDAGGGGIETDGHMDVDTEDDSQISSSENGISETTISDGISNLKKDLLLKTTDNHQQKKLIIDEDKSQSSIGNDSSSDSSKSRISDDINHDDDDDKKNGSGGDKDDNNSSQDSKDKLESTKNNHDDKSIDAMDIDSKSKTNNDDDDETTQETSKTEENDLSENDDKSNLKAENKTIDKKNEIMDVDDFDVTNTGDSKSQDESTKISIDSKILEISERKNIDESSTTKDSTKSNENSKDSTEFSKRNGEINSTKISTASNESNTKIASTNDDKGNTSGDDVQVIESDDDEDPFKDVPHHNESLGKLKKLNNNDDDDDAVVIQSDSENESDKSTTKTKVENSNTISQDDDDCVVIDDDDDDDDDNNQSKLNNSSNQNNLTTDSLSASNLSRRSSQRQRKSVVQVRDFAAFDSDDIQEIDLTTQPPPAKRQKPNTIQNSPNSGILNLSSPVGTLTIKDARSLCQEQQSPKTYLHSFLQSTGVSDLNHTAKQLINNINSSSPTTTNNTAFPIGLRPALAPLSNTQIPKLAPVSNLVNTNANLLPALTDDMFVLEAPSFIVPYIYEKPPSQNLKDIVTKLATEFDLNKLKDIKKHNDLDLLELQSKLSKTTDNDDDINKKVDGNDDKKLKKHKKRTNQNDDDDAWHESDESTDDEASDDDSLTRTKVIIDKAETDLDAIKSALVPAEQIVNNSSSSSSVKDPLAVPNESNSGVGGNGNNSIDKIKSENYFESPLGKFFQDIGIGLVQEHVQADILKVQKRRLRKCESGSEQAAQYEFAINALTKNLNTSKKQNEPFKFNMKRCEFCNFKTESTLVMAQHYETPHLEKNLYKCNFCSFEIRHTQDIVFHMEAVHNIKGRLDKPQSYHQCPNCPFEDNGKSKMLRHQPVCAKKYRPEINLCPPQDWEAPAKIPRIKPRHGLVGTATAYQAMAAQAAAQKAALATLQQQQQAARNLMAASSAANRNRTNIGPGGSIGMARQNTNNKVQGIRNVPNNIMNSRGGGGVNNAQIQMRQQQMLTQNVVLPNNYQIQGGQLIQIAGSSLAILPNSQNSFTFQSQQKKSGQQPSISITPLPRQSNLSAQNSSSPSSSSHQSMPINAKPGLKPGQTPSGNKFVICEICDGYIKDLEQLRNHMQWMHKVKIHPKMIYNRPPLNCQKCQFRFFTDQGLERHLLGSHGLVTSSMQEAANKGKDAGRCPVCGRMYQWKLLNHVSRDHNMTLKPAHLSYKCTVCTATFGMYKQFENHVYTAHSTVAKKAMTNDGNKKNSNNSSSNNNINSNSNNSSNQNRNNLSLSGTNDSLLKPLRINDEITIIPQPATKKT